MLPTPFLEGNGRATRIWLDMIFIKELQKCTDWSKINKNDYLDAMKASPTSDEFLKDLLKNALTKDIDNKELFMKGIDASYYYEEVKQTFKSVNSIINMPTILNDPKAD